MTSQDAAREIEALKSKFWNPIELCWMIDGEKASKETTLEFQRKIRLLKFTFQENLDNVRMQDKATNFLQRVALKALISRRSSPSLWPLINKIEPDGILFTFDQIETDDILICGCTDEQLMEQIEAYEKELPVKTLDAPKFANEQEEAEWWDKQDILPIFEEGTKRRQKAVEQMTGFPDKTDLDVCIAVVRSQHDLMVQGVHKTGASCNNPKTISMRIKQSTHTIGNVNCQACVVMGSAKDSEEPILEKFLELCPRFKPMLRNDSMQEYLSVFSASGQAVESRHLPLCYAGLMHVQMKQETYYKDLDGKLISPSELIFFATFRLQEVLVFTKKCDTCGHTEVEVKEYNLPEPIVAGEELGIE